VPTIDAAGFSWRCTRRVVKGEGVDLDEQSLLSRDATFSKRTEAVIRDMILGGSLAPGERLNEVTLSQGLGISRGPLREAIQRLAGEGLLTLVSHRGAFVRTFERREVEELYDLRTALEMYLARLVCARASDAQLAELEALVRDAAEELSQAPDTAFPSDRDLHSRLIDLGGNVTLGRAAVEAQRQISLARRISAQGAVRARQAQDEHQDLIAAIVRRDEDEAAAQMRRHLDLARRSALGALGFESE
jgi:DNA-binding GntR family transcriptional regulator